MNGELQFQTERKKITGSGQTPTEKKIGRRKIMRLRISWRSSEHKAEAAGKIEALNNEFKKPNTELGARTRLDIQAFEFQVNGSPCVKPGENVIINHQVPHSRKL